MSAHDQEILGYQRALKEAREQAEGLRQQLTEQIFTLCQALQEMGIASLRPNYAGNRSMQGLILQIRNYVNGGGDMARDQVGKLPEDTEDEPTQEPTGASQAEINAAIIQQLSALGTAIDELKGAKNEG